MIRPPTPTWEWMALAWLVLAAILLAVGGSARGHDCEGGLIPACVVAPPTRTATRTLRPTLTPRPTYTLRPTRTPWPTRTATRTRTETRTKTATRTRTWTKTATVTKTQRTTATPTLHYSPVQPPDTPTPALPIDPAAPVPVTGVIRVAQIDVLPSSNAYNLGTTNSDWPIVSDQNGMQLTKARTAVDSGMAHVVDSLAAATGRTVEVTRHLVSNQTPPILPWEPNPEYGVVDFHELLLRTDPNFLTDPTPIVILWAPTFQGVFHAEYLLSNPLTHYSEVPRASNGYVLVWCGLDRPAAFCLHGLGHAIEHWALAHDGRELYDQTVGTRTANNEAWVPPYGIGDVHTPPGCVGHYRYYCPVTAVDTAVGPVVCRRPGRTEPQTWLCANIEYDPIPYTSMCTAQPLKCGWWDGHYQYLRWWLANIPRHWWTCLLDYNGGCR